MVDVRLLLTVSLLCLVFSTGLFAEVKITITPAKLTLTPDQADRKQGRVTVTCRFVPDKASLVDMQILNQLFINRTLPGTTRNSPIVRATDDSNNDNAELLSDIPGATVSGSVKSYAITINLNQATCHDGAYFYCTAQYEYVLYTVDSDWPVRDPKSEHSQEILTTHVTPGPLRLTPSPNKTASWTVDEVLTMTCQGPLGTVTPKQRVEWVWEYRQNVSEKNSWSPYDGRIPDVESDAVTDAPRNACYKQGRSVLTRRLTLTDSNRCYRCYVMIDGIPYQQFAAEHFVEAVVDSSLERPEDPLLPSLFLGLGVVGGLLMMVAAGVGFALWKRRRLLTTEQTQNCPLLPTYRDPGYYGEYMEPVVRVPREEGERSVRIYTGNSNIYEEINLASNVVTPHSSATSPKQVVATGSADPTSR